LAGDEEEFTLLSAYPHLGVQPSLEVQDDGTCKCIHTQVAVSAIDLGSAIYRFELIKKHNLRYRNCPNLFAADGYFATNYRAIENVSVRIVRQLLFIHQ